MQQQKPRNELYEFPLEALTYKQQINRRLNLLREILINQALRLREIRKKYEEDPTSVRTQPGGQGQEPLRITITQDLISQQATVKESREQYELLLEMAEAAEKGDAEVEAFWNDEALKNPENDPAPQPSPIQIGKEEGGDEAGAKQ